MSRVKRGIMHNKRRKNILKKAKGFKWGRKSRITLAKTAIKRAGQFAYSSRRTKKRAARRLWIAKLNAAVRELGLTYSQLIGKMNKNKVELDRKVLANFAENNPKIFTAIIEEIK